VHPVPCAEVFPSLGYHGDQRGGHPDGLEATCAYIEGLSLNQLTSPRQIPRPIFDAVVAWAKRGDKTQFWKGPQNRHGTLSRAEAVRESLSNLRRSVSLSIRGTVGKTDE